MTDQLEDQHIAFPHSFTLEGFYDVDCIDALRAAPVGGPDGLLEDRVRLLVQ